MRELKAQLCARWDEMLLILGLEAGFFIIAEIFMALEIEKNGYTNIDSMIGNDNDE